MKMTLTRPKTVTEPVADASDDVRSTSSASNPNARGGKTTKKKKSSASKANSASRDAVVALGAEPRVDLLPPEVRTLRKAKKTRRALGYGVVAVVILTLAAIGGATLFALQAQSQLSVAQANTGTLLAEQAKYIKVQNVQKEVQLVQAAQKVGASSEIDWQTYLDNVQAVLPADVTISSVIVASQSPIALFSQPSAALQSADVATVTFTADSPVVPLIPAWLNGLATLNGYAGAIPTSTTLNTSTGHYIVNITLDVSAAAFDNRFETKGK